MPPFFFTYLFFNHIVKKYPDHKVRRMYFIYMVLFGIGVMLLMTASYAVKDWARGRLTASYWKMVAAMIPCGILTGLLVASFEWIFVLRKHNISEYRENLLNEEKNVRNVK